MVGWLVGIAIYSMAMSIARSIAKKRSEGENE